MTRLRSVLTGVSLFGFAWLIRALPATSVLAADRVHFTGSEAYTHLRRVRYALENFPSLLAFDPYAAFPHGAEASWPPLFDASMGVVLAPFALLGDVGSMERAAAWAPSVLGAATVVAAWALARRAFGEGVALGAAAFLAILGGHFVDTQIGAFGPAPALSLFSTLLLAATMSALDGDARRPVLAAALAAAVCLLLAPEGVLYAAAALGALAVSALRARGAARTLRRRHAALAALLFAAVVAAGFLVLPWSGSLAEAWRQIAGAGGAVFPGSGGEAQPLFELGGRFDGRIATRSLSYLVYLYPLLWALGFREARQADSRAPLLFFVAWSALLFAATLWQRRFLGVFAVAFAIGCAWSVAATASRLRMRGSDASGVAGLLLLVLLLPLRSNYVPHLRNLLVAEEGESLEMSRAARIDRLRYSVAAWLRIATPTTAGWTGGSGSPRYGVFAPRELGRVIRYVGRRPSVVDGFGPAGEEALGLRVWSSPPEEASGILDALGARYLVARTDDRRIEVYSPASLYRTLVLRNGSAGPGEGPAGAAGRFRLFYESGRLRSGIRRPPLYRVFEHVPGARIEGRAAAGERVDLGLELVSHGVRPLTYSDHTTADADGRYHFVVPYANVGSSGKVVAAASYRLSCAAEEVSVVVREGQVRRGTRVPAPDLCRGPRP